MKFTSPPSLLLAARDRSVRPDRIRSTCSSATLRLLLNASAATNLVCMYGMDFTSICQVEYTFENSRGAKMGHIHGMLLTVTEGEDQVYQKEEEDQEEEEEEEEEEEQ
ncbi:unnamed protein product [Mortierella alpina]